MKCKCGKMMKVEYFKEGKRSVVYRWICPACGYKTTSIEEK
jgi:rubrerythrin